MQHFPTAAITDEFSTEDLDRALGAMRDVGMTGAELRLVFGTNAIELGDEDLARARRSVEAHGMSVVGFASPLLKCVLPDAPAVDPRFQQDVFGSAYKYEDQPRLTRRAFDVAEITGAPVIRVFSYWRTVEPGAVLDRVAEALTALADEAASRGVIIGLENEHACNVGTGHEAATLLAMVDHPALRLIWDPANAFDSRRDAVSRWLRAAAGRPDRSRAREGLQDCRRRHPDVGTARRDGHRVAGPDRRPRARRLPRGDQPRDALAGTERRPNGGEHDLRRALNFASAR